MSDLCPNKSVARAPDPESEWARQKRVARVAYPIVVAMIEALASEDTRLRAKAVAMWRDMDEKMTAVLTNIAEAETGLEDAEERLEDAEKCKEGLDAEFRDAAANAYSRPMDTQWADLVEVRARVVETKACVVEMKARVVALGSHWKRAVTANEKDIKCALDVGARVEVVDAQLSGLKAMKARFIRDAASTGAH